MGREGRGRGQVVGATREGIRLAIAGPFPIQDGVAESSQGGCPPRMAAGRRPCFTEVLQVLVVGKYPNRVSCTLHSHPPLFECDHHCQQLLVIDRVVEPRRSEFSAVEANGVQVVVICKVRYVILGLRMMLMGPGTIPPGHPTMCAHG